MIKHLESSLIEKDVENSWRQKIGELFKECTITSPYNTDGYLISPDEKISVLFEFKFDENMKSKLSQVNVLSQTLFYLKKFEKDGRKLPRVIMIADRNECFIMHSNPLLKYLDFNLNWNVAASSAFKTNPELIAEMINDGDINPFVFDIRDGFNFLAIKNKIIDLSQNTKRLIKVTEHNINSVFEYFQKNVLGKNALSVNEVANLFVNLLINPNENYMHPKRKNILISKSFGEIYVNTDKYISFFSHFDGEQYSIREKEALTAIVDRIVEDETRRRKGEFFTPTIWVDEAHKMISEAFGENWKEEYVVWDPASGTLNLTRDYKFKELYCSTLEESDLKTAEQMRYNPEAVKFQYDFLNDGIVDGKIDIEGDMKLPEGLKRALVEGKKMIVLMNPPYAKATTKVSGDSVGVAKNNLNSIMVGNNMGISSSTTYAQFLYRCCFYKNVNICIFSKPTFLTGPSFRSFRKLFFDKFSFQDAMLLQASEFDDVSSAWGINFSIWKEGFCDSREYFVHKLAKLNSQFEVEIYSDKILYNIDYHKSAGEWCFGKIKNELTFPNLKSGLNICQKSKNKISEGSLGSINNHSNNQMQQQVVFLSSACVSGNGHKSITDENFYKSCSLFLTRKIVACNWINDKDEYMAPNESHPLWEQFQNDSVVYSLFNTSSNQSSLRQITYKDKLWDIKNEFFWMPKSEMMDLAEKKFFDDVYRDARQSDERYVYNLLHKEGLYDKLSPDAKEVLDMASQLVRLSFDMRKVLNEEHPEYHLNTWDAGWYQIKLVLKQFFPDQLKEFTKKYKEFEDRMRPLVYELGFLRK